MSWMLILTLLDVNKYYHVQVSVPMSSMRACVEASNGVDGYRLDKTTYKKHKLVVSAQCKEVKPK